MTILAITAIRWGSFFLFGCLIGYFLFFVVLRKK